MTLIEQVFRKMGFSIKRGSLSDWYYWIDYDGIEVDLVTGSFDDERINEADVIKILPKIDSQWEVTAKYLVPFMRRKGYIYNIPLLNPLEFWWVPDKNYEDEKVKSAKIKDDNIAEAACKAFMDVELGNTFKDITFGDSSEGIKIK